MLLIEPDVELSQEDFHFKIGITPLSSWHLAWLVPLLYLGLLASVKGLVRRCTPDGRGFGLRQLVVFHNASLAAVSAILFVDMVWELGQMFVEGGAWSVFVD